MGAVLNARLTIAQELNERPRQTLGFKTPSQALAEVLR
jgi:IS30 family transposase